MSAINRYSGGNGPFSTLATLARGNNQVQGPKSASSTSVRGGSPNISKAELYRAIRIVENLGSQGSHIKIKIPIFNTPIFEHNTRNDRRITLDELGKGYPILMEALREQPLENGLRKLLQLDDTCKETLGSKADLEAHKADLEAHKADPAAYKVKLEAYKVKLGHVRNYYTRMLEVVKYMYDNRKEIAGADRMMSPEDIEKMWK